MFGAHELIDIYTDCSLLLYNNMSNNHYTNNYKKLLGIDESRTAS
jgi:hypothetical protein